MARTDANSIPHRTFALLSAFLIVAAMYFCREVLLPIALAILFSFLLAPLVDRLEKWGVHRIVSVLLAVALCFASVGGLGYVLSRQVYDLAYDLPEYKVNIIDKVRSFQSNPDGAIGRASRALKEVQENVLPKKSKTAAIQAPRKSVDDVQAPPDAGGNTVEEKKGVEGSPNEAIELQVNEPVPVQIVEQYSFDKFFESILGPAFSVLAMAAIVVVFVIFILLEREDLRNRMIYLVGSRQLTQTTEVLDDAAQRVSRYLVMQLVLNVAYGIVIAIGLYFIGLPNALLWGALTGILRFVPYIGPWLGAIMPLAVSLAVFDGWTRPILVLSVFIANEFISNNVFEPWLYGSSTGISSIGILVSAVFWTWLWGPVGLVMATPLTVCLTSLGRFVPELAFVRTLISTQEKLPPATRFYQRLLANDPEEAVEIAEDFLEEHSLEELYDQVLMPALSLAEHDRHQGDLDDEKVQFIGSSMRECIDDFGLLAKQKSAKEDEGGVTEAENRAAKAPQETTILCVPARDEADEIAGLMLAQLLDRRGRKCRVLSTSALAAEVLNQVDEHATPLVCVSALPPHAATHARYICKRMRPKFPKMKIVVGLWESGGTTRKAQDRLSEVGVDKFVNSLTEAADQIAILAAQASVIANDDGAATPSAVPPPHLPAKRAVEAR